MLTLPNERHEKSKIERKKIRKNITNRPKKNQKKRRGTKGTAAIQQDKNNTIKLTGHHFQNLK